MKKSKIIALLLCLLMTVSVFAGCGDDSANNDKDDKEQTSAVDKDDEASEKDETSDKTDSEDDKKDDSADKDDSDDVEDEKVLSKGTVNGKVYTSEFSGLKITVPAGWTYMTDEELAELIGYTSDFYDNEAYDKLIEQASSVFDMMVMDVATNSNISVSYEKNGVYSEAEYLEILESQYLSMGIYDDIELVGTSEKEICGNTYTCAEFKIELSGMEMTQALYVRNIGQYINLISATITSGYTISDIEAMFG